MAEEAPRRLRRAEAVLRRRTGRILLVAERCTDVHNHLALLRTAEAYGIQKVWLVEQPDAQLETLKKSVTKGAHAWLSLRTLPSPAACVEALREEGWAIWATDLGRGAEEATLVALTPLPDKVALVVGRESDGVSEEMLAAADRRLWLPLHGFGESLNLSVATGILLQRLFDACPEAHGDLDEEERAALRASWFRRLGGKEPERFARWIDDPPEPLEELRPPPEARRPRMPKKLAKRLGIDLERG